MLRAVYGLAPHLLARAVSWLPPRRVVPPPRTRPRLLQPRRHFLARMATPVPPARAAHLALCIPCHPMVLRTLHMRLALWFPFLLRSRAYFKGFWLPSQGYVRASAVRRPGRQPRLCGFDSITSAAYTHRFGASLRCSVSAPSPVRESVIVRSPSPRCRPRAFLQGPCLFVYNLPHDVDENVLLSLFAYYATVTSVKVRCAGDVLPSSPAARPPPRSPFLAGVHCMCACVLLSRLPATAVVCPRASAS